MHRLTTLACWMACTCCGLAGALAAEPVSFRSDIAPLLRDHCLACHGPKKAEGGYRVDSYDALLVAGDSGEVPIATMPEQASEVLRRIASHDESERMPAEAEALSAAQIELFRQWLEAGGKFDGDNSSAPLELVIPPPQYPPPPASYPQPVPILATCFTPDGQYVVAGGYHELTVWNPADASLVRRIPNIGQRVFALTFAADGKTLAVGCGEPGRSGEVRLVDFESGEVTAVVARTTDVVLDVAFRPGTHELAVAAADSIIRIIDTQALTEVRAIASHADWVTAVAWSEDGTRLASASRDKSAKVYDGATGELLSSYLGHGAAVRGVAILPGATQVVSSGADQKLHRWEIEGAKKTAETALGAEAFKLVQLPKSVLVPCAERRLIQVDLETNKISHQFDGHQDWVLSIAARTSPTDDPASALLASGAFNGEIRVWNAVDGSSVAAWVAKP